MTTGLDTNTLSDMPSRQEPSQDTAPPDEDWSMQDAPAEDHIPEDANPALLAFDEQRIRIVTPPHTS